MGILKNNYKLLLVLIHDLCVGFLSFVLALAFRFSLTDHNWITHIPSLNEKILIILVVQTIIFTSLGLYRGVWRFSSTHDLKQVIKASALTSCTVWIAFFFSNNLEFVPRSSIVMQFCFLILGTGGGRFAYRLYKESSSSVRGKETLIIGAGVAAEELIRDIKRYYPEKFKLVGLLDDDIRLKGRSIHGIKVLGPTTDIKKFSESNLKQIFIAIPTAKPAEIRRIVFLCKSLQKVEIKTLPNIEDIINGKIKTSNLREVKLDDLLGRDPIQLDLNSIGKQLTNKTVLITGAGGSIGSELATQVARFNPSKLIVLDVCEFFLYEVERKLKKQFPTINIVPYVADVKNEPRLHSVFTKDKVDIIYHAAAYKQVPLMERNYQEAVLTNVQGTLILAKSALKYKVKRFVMVSTDKAVNPTNVMGATKRIAEMICQELSSSETKFTNVRFGNVLGSNGSVIPLFEEQIKAGGPLTLTHKDITRYFMSIPEAGQLILQAGSMGYGGEIFILDMGEPIKIYDLALQMISLSGLKPFEDIEVKITGLRPGEKLYEELLADEESTLKTPHPSVRVACARKVPGDLFEKISELLSSLYTLEEDEFKLLLKKVVLEYTPEIKGQGHESLTIH